MSHCKSSTLQDILKEHSVLLRNLFLAEHYYNSVIQNRKEVISLQLAKLVLPHCVQPVKQILQLEF